MRKTITVLLMAAAIIAFTGCEDDSSSSKDTVLETGNSTIRGNITDFGDIQVKAVSAKVAATIPVWLKGTTTETYTDENGNFIFENIPAGDYTIAFTIDGKTYEYQVSVSDGATLIISNLGVSPDGTVTVSSIREDRPSSGNSPEPEPQAESQAEQQAESTPSETPPDRDPPQAWDKAYSKFYWCDADGNKIGVMRTEYYEWWEYDQTWKIYGFGPITPGEDLSAVAGRIVIEDTRWYP